jgi:3',5'-cyclic AMP phosphodiesterase CpdA
MTPEAQEQLAWLGSDLAAANNDRTAHPFIFVYSHRGLFSTSMHSADPDVLEARTILAPIYAQYKVDGVFNGHDHEYERTYPITPGSPITGDPNVVQSGGTVYSICAGVGADPYAVGTSSETWRATKSAFGNVATSTPNSTWLGFYSTLSLGTASVKLTAYALTSAGNDPVVDTYTFQH